MLGVCSQETSARFDIQIEAERTLYFVHKNIRTVVDGIRLWKSQYPELDLWKYVEARRAFGFPDPPMTQSQKDLVECHIWGCGPGCPCVPKWD